ncbi:MULTISPECIES: hypothetical protein [Thermomonosporaceae]|uniref:hypothetical protein n=1 Tax=Thermomonosporaceae TaxID=2012 RepID=UPI00255AFF65|nr:MULTISPECIES: hypothetical protein [Thermomonosporaceae]MDL4773034.1 hypothetical protein [Actinomadura xylanilytica]
MGFARIARPLLATAVVAATVTTLAPAASASTERCIYSDDSRMKKTFPTPGTDTSFAINLCVIKRSDGKHYAYADVHWNNGGDSDTDDKRKFDRFNVTVRLERNDVVKTFRLCDIRHAVNTQKSGIELCVTSVDASTANGGWTADGWAQYDLDRDGQGVKAWEWYGSPSV